MRGPNRPAISGQRLKDMAANARLGLDEARAEALSPVAEQVFAMLDGLDAVKLGDTPPAFSFDARWKG